MKCATCGSGLDLSHPFCDNCGTPVPSDQTVLPPLQVMTGGNGPAPHDWAPAVGAVVRPDQHAPAPAPPMAPLPFPTLPGSPIRLGIGEKVWRCYQVLNYKRLSKGEGYLYLTDSRLVFFAYSTGLGTQKSSILVQQVELSSIAGLNTYVTRKFSLALLGIALALFVLGVGLLFSIIFIPLAFVCWLGSVASIISLLMGGGHVGTTILSVNARRDGVVSFGGNEKVTGSFGRIVYSVIHPLSYFLGGTTADYVAEFGLPGKDSDMVVQELGALILDLQQRGDAAAEHWQLSALAQGPAPMPGRERERGAARA